MGICCSSTNDKKHTGASQSNSTKTALVSVETFPKNSDASKSVNPNKEKGRKESVSLKKPIKFKPISEKTRHEGKKHP